MQGLFSFQMLFTFENRSTGSGEILTYRRDLFPLRFQRKQQKRGKDCLTMIDN